MADHRNALGTMGPEVPTVTKGRRPVALAVADAPAGPVVESLPPAKLRRDGETQYRVQVDPAIVGEYRRLIAEGAQDAIADGDRTADGRVIWPFRDPVDAVRDAETGDTWLIDGFQRLEAWGLHFGDSSLESVPVVPVRVTVVARDGLRAARLAAAGSNSAHGAPRTDADKRNAVDKLLADPEWAQWSDREIARRAGVSAPFVGARRQALAAKATGSAVAGSLGHAPAPAVRKFTDSAGHTRTMDTGAIGRKPSKADAEFGRHAKGAAWGDRDSLEYGRQQAAAGNLAHGKLGGGAAVPAQPSTPPAVQNPAAAPAGGAVDGLAAVHDHLVALVDALPLLRREMADPASAALWQKLQAAIVPAVERVGAYLVARE